MTGTELLRHLLGRGDAVSITNGRLQITSASGQPVPGEWLAQHRERLTVAIVQAVGMDALTYTGYTTGNFNKGRSPGVMLHFSHLLTGQEYRITFNAILTRERNSRGGKKGSPLPSGRFRIKERHTFKGFWLRTGLPLPRFDSEYWEYMGNLKPITFQGADNYTGKLEKDSLKPLTISPDQLQQTMNIPTLLPGSHRELTGNSPGSDREASPGRNLPDTKGFQDLQPIQSAGRESAYNVLSIAGNVLPSLTSNTAPDMGESTLPISREGTLNIQPCTMIRSSKKRPQDQTDEEWLDDFAGTAREHGA